MWIASGTSFSVAVGELRRRQAYVFCARVGNETGTGRHVEAVIVRPFNTRFRVGERYGMDQFCVLEGHFAAYLFARRRSFVAGVGHEGRTRHRMFVRVWFSWCAC